MFYLISFSSFLRSGWNKIFKNRFTMFLFREKFLEDFLEILPTYIEC
jgi:hypothetical protein